MPSFSPKLHRGYWTILLCLRGLGLLLMSSSFLAWIFEIGPVLARPLLLLAGALLCWWTVHILEDEPTATD